MAQLNDWNFILPGKGSVRLCMVRSQNSEVISPTDSPIRYMSRAASLWFSHANALTSRYTVVVVFPSSVNKSSPLQCCAQSRYMFTKLQRIVFAAKRARNIRKVNAEYKHGLMCGDGGGARGQS
eukprot:scaffold426198_cov49-Prasinocladus_malaysianus.AAC.1